MPRPTNITNEQIAEYDQRIDADHSTLAQNPIIREICRAGQWLNDRLTELDCPPSIIGQLMYSAGRMCFGRSDPWEVHQEVLTGYIDGTLEFEAELDDLN